MDVMDRGGDGRCREQAGEGCGSHEDDSSRRRTRRRRRRGDGDGGANEVTGAIEGAGLVGGTGSVGGNDLGRDVGVLEDDGRLGRLGVGAWVERDRAFGVRCLHVSRGDGHVGGVELVGLVGDGLKHPLHLFPLRVRLRGGPVLALASGRPIRERGALCRLRRCGRGRLFAHKALGALLSPLRGLGGMAGWGT